MLHAALASHCSAHGPGLVEGVVNQAGTFVVLTPGKGTLVVKVVGPKSEAKVEVKKGSNGQYDVRTDFELALFHSNGSASRSATIRRSPAATRSTSPSTASTFRVLNEAALCEDVSLTCSPMLVAGSIFRVYVLEQESLGGEGKVRVFFSTTSSTEKGRQDFFALERLMTGKEIHLRPDFEPWVPVDVLDKAGTCRVGECRAVRVVPTGAL